MIDEKDLSLLGRSRTRRALFKKQQAEEQRQQFETEEKPLKLKKKQSRQSNRSFETDE